MCRGMRRNPQHTNTHWPTIPRRRNSIPASLNLTVGCVGITVDFRIKFARKSIASVGSQWARRQGHEAEAHSRREAACRRAGQASGSMKLVWAAFALFDRRKYLHTSRPTTRPPPSTVDERIVALAARVSRPSGISTRTTELPMLRALGSQRRSRVAFGCEAAHAASFH